MFHHVLHRLCTTTTLPQTITIRTLTNHLITSLPTVTIKRSASTAFETRLSNGGIPTIELPYHHFFKKSNHPNHRNGETKIVKPPKFKSPRKRANKIFRTINREAINASKAASPKVHDTHFRVGDAIELTMVVQGGVNSTKLDKICGVVLGRINRGLGSGLYLRDVVFGEPINRKMQLHSPMIKEIEVLEKNFVFKGKRKVKRAKLYYLMDRLPQETRVTKV